MIKKILIGILLFTSVYTQNYDNVGMRDDDTSGQYSFTESDTIHPIRVNWSTSGNTVVRIDEVMIRYYTSSNATGAPADSASLTVHNKSSNFADPATARANMPASINTSYNSFDLRIILLDNGFNNDTIYSRDISAESGFQNYGTIDHGLVMSELGFKDLVGDDRYISTTTDSLLIRFDVSSGTVPANANAVRVYQLNSSNGELTNTLFSNVAINTITGGDEEYQIRLDQPFSSFNASLDHFVVTVQLESGGTVYASSTISAGSQTVISDNVMASGTWYSTLLDGTPVINKIGIQAATSNDQALNLSESIEVRFQIAANGEVPSTGDISIYEFNGNSQVGSATTRSGASISTSGSDYVATITGLSSFGSNVDSIAVLIDLTNTSTNYVSKSQITGTHITDNTVSGGGGTYHSVLNRTNVGPSAPSTFTFRYGAPSDDRIYLTWPNDASAGDVALNRYKLVYSTGAAVAANDTTGSGSVVLAVAAQTNYELNLSGTYGVRLFIIDNNNEYASIALNSNATVNFANGLTQTLAGTGGFSVANLQPGNSSDNEVLSFTITPSGTIQSGDQVILNSVTITAADSNSNVSSDQLSNFRLVRDVNTNNVYNSGTDEILNSVGVAWADGSFTISTNQNNTVNSSSTERFLLICDASSVNSSMLVNLRINSASTDIGLTADNGIVAARTGTMAGSVAAQGVDDDNDISLPVALVEGSFAAEKIENGFMLSAKTASEDQVAYIYYQRSIVDKPITELKEEDWTFTGLKIQSSSKYATSGRDLPNLVDYVDTKDLKILRYRMISEEIDGSFKTKYDGNKNIISVDPNVLKISTFSLKQNFPNPFNPTTSITFDVPFTSEVSIEIFNLLGQKIKTLAKNKKFTAGLQTMSWDATNDFGRKVASGLYMYRMSTKDGRFVGTRKMMLVK